MALQVNITKQFSGFLLQVDFETDGGCLGILGASGCGKTMTLKCIAGIEKPDSGRIVLNGKVLFDSEKKINLPTQERHVGYLFQNYALFPTMTVEENLAIAIPKKCPDRKKLVEQQIQKFQLEGLQKRYPSQLSGGQQQRAALARMLLTEPEIIMLDEPFSALDGYLKDILQMEMLEVLRRFSKDTLLVTHSRDEIFKFCERMVLLENGACILKGVTREVFQRPGRLEAARLTGCKNFSAIERISEYELYAVDWKIRLHTEEKIGENIRYVGIRGHRLLPSDRPGENIMRVVQTGYSETTFERQYLFRNAEDDDAGKIWWMCKRRDFEEYKEDEFPQYLYFPGEHLMLLS